MSMAKTRSQEQISRGLDVATAQISASLAQAKVYQAVKRSAIAEVKRRIDQIFKQLDKKARI